jgi:hypothetical protein
MARKVKRNVSRPIDARQAIVREYMTRPWYELPDWAVLWLSDNAGWTALILTILLTPVVILAIVLGAHSLPLEFLGIPTSANSLGPVAIIFLIEFVFLALAVRPLMRLERRGWFYAMAAAFAHMVSGFISNHGISGVLILLAVVYVYWQVRHRLS